MRYKWIDVYRGIAVLFMVTLHSFVNIFPIQPISFLNYSMRDAIAIGDMTVALFLFISGVSACLSICDRKKKSEDEAIKRVLFRYSKIFVLGLLLDIILIASVDRIWWVLENIGLSGIIALLYICFSDRMKILAIAILGIGYACLTSMQPVYNLVSLFPNGGLLGALPLSGIVLVGYMCGERIMVRKEKALPILLKAGILLMLAGFALSHFITYDRSIGSFSFVVLSSGFCILLMVLVYWLVELNGIHLGILEDFGKSALLIFVLNYPMLILSILLKIDRSFTIEQAALITLVLVSLLAIVAKAYPRFKER